MKTGVEQPQSFNLSIIQSGIIESENHPINEINQSRRHRRDAATKTRAEVFKFRLSRAKVEQPKLKPQGAEV